MAKQVETIWDYLDSKWFPNTPRTEKHTVQLVLESEKLNSAQKKRMESNIPLYEVSEKLDGVYSLVTVIPVIGDIEIRHWGRSGKAQTGCEALDIKLREEIGLRKYVPPVILVSEVTSDDPLAKLSGHMNPNRNSDHGFTPTNLKDNFHEFLTVQDFISGVSDGNRERRVDSLQGFLDNTDLSIIPSKLMSYEAAKKKAVEEIFPRGGEGLVCRDPFAHWIAGARHEEMIKIKEKLSFDVTVVGYCTGKEGSKYEDVLGKLLVAFRAFGKPDGEPLLIPISGMTDAQRKLWIKQPELIVGATVKMDAKSYTETGNLREPRYKETRNDKGSDFPVVLKGNPEAYVKAKCMWVEHSWRIK